MEAPDDAAVAMAAAGGDGTAAGGAGADQELLAVPGQEPKRQRLPADAAGIDARPDAAPPLLHVLAANLVTAGAVWLLVDTADVVALRRLHPLIACAVAQVPWCDVTTPVYDVVRWRAAFPAAIVRAARCRCAPGTAPVARNERGRRLAARYKG